MTEDEQLMIGLEIHVQLTALKTKLFCNCSTDYRGGEENKYLCPRCLGLPGSLPSLNRQALDYAVMVGLALHSRISEYSLFYLCGYVTNSQPVNIVIVIVPVSTVVVIIVWVWGLNFNPKPIFSFQGILGHVFEA